MLQAETPRRGRQFDVHGNREETIRRIWGDGLESNAGREALMDDQTPRNASNFRQWEFELPATT